MGKKLNTIDFINQAIKIHGIEYDYSLVIYKNNKTVVRIICRKHGIFNQLPINHINNKSGCPACYGKLKLTTLEFIEKAILIHKEKYDYSIVNYINSAVKIDIICRKHGIFKQLPHSHLEGHGCNLCNKNDLEMIIDKSIEIYGDLYDYSLVKYKDNKTKINIICKIHGEISVTIQRFLYKKSGCPYCVNNVYKDLSYFILHANKIHGDKFTYKIINDLNKHSNIIIICPTHGEFIQRINSHINGSGCKNCYADYRRKELSNLILEFNIKHLEKYDYSLVNYKNNRTKIEIICKKHGMFKQRAKQHLRGEGCPSCNESKGELAIYNYLVKNNIIFNREQKFNNCLNKKQLRFDFYLPTHNLCIEYDGEQHFNPVDCFGGLKSFNQVKINDIIKNEFCENNGIKLIRIIYYELYKIESILDDLLKINI